MNPDLKALYVWDMKVERVTKDKDGVITITLLCYANLDTFILTPNKSGVV